MSIDAGMASVIVAGIAALGTIVNTVIAKRQNHKITETHKQVTVNHHSSDFPTVLDRIDDVRVAVLGLGSDLGHLRNDFNTHVAHSNEMDLRLIKVELKNGSEA